MQGRLEQRTQSDKTGFSFGPKNENGLRDLFYAKGAMFSIMCFSMIVLLLVLFFFVLPFDLEVPLVILRLSILLASWLIYYLFHRSLIEIVVDGDYLRLRTFRNYRKLLLKEIQSVSIHRFAAWGIATVHFRTHKSSMYTLWSPGFERERYESFLNLVEFLKEESQGKFQFSFRT